MSGKKLALLLLVLLALSAGAVLAKDSGAATGFQVVKDASGSMKLRITADAASDGMWLGVTLYPPKAKEGRSQILPLKRGQNTQDISIVPSLENGTFEAAVWSRKLSKQECEPGDDTCRKNGYKLTGMVSYLWGYLKGEQP